jgi:hypothetical protein
MNLSRAFSAPFQDPMLVSTLILTGIIALLSAALTPVLVGLVGVAAILGYQVDMVRSARAGTRRLPAWDDMGRLARQGGTPLAALVIFNLPNLALSCFATLFLSSASSAPASALTILGVTCCLLPSFLVYNALILPLHALGMGRYALDPRGANAFFEVAPLLRLMRARADVTLQYLIGIVIIVVGATLIGAVPCLGWFAAAALTVPLVGSLGAEYVTAILGDPSKPIIM